jgi:hypothetical protein
MFKFNEAKQVQPLYWRYNEASSALNGLTVNTSTDKSLDFFMTPYSGTVYGDYGGITSAILANRAAYQTVWKEITPAVCEALLYSKNPATRLSGIEYYYQNASRFKNQKQRVESRIKAIYKELPVVTTMRGCEESVENSEELVNGFVKHH